MSTTERVHAVIDRIEAACEACGRDPGNVDLMLAVKHRSIAEIREALDALAHAGRPALIGHNHVQQALSTVPELRESHPDLEAHLIGHLQTNKIGKAVGCLDVIDTVDSIRLANKLARRGSLRVMVEVNVSGEATKTGSPLSEAEELLDHIETLPNLTVIGLMTVGALSSDTEQVRRGFEALRDLRRDASWRLSMGMSGDMETAIASGSTLVRIGTDVFGPRP